MSDGSYIRGGGGVNVEGARLGAALALAVVIVLAGCTVWQLVSTAAANSASDRLRRSGVPVSITVTGCSGISSGIGMGIEYYQCEGTYRLNGVQVTALIHGSQALIPSGRVVPGRVVPTDSTSLTRTGPGSTPPPQPSVGSYTVTIILGGLTLVGGAALIVWRHRGRLKLPPPS
ncbi:MAG: hypothetical protein M0Z30_09370 [Actinomycetota bacterium]|nr:hypothetical protein [Actinomycetota bacterium]